MNRHTGEWIRWGISPQRGSALVVLACALLVCACGTDGVDSPHADPRAAPAGLRTHAPGSVGRSEASDSIASAWVAAEQAFEMAARSSDPDEPELAATTVAPQIGSTQSLLEGWQAAGEIARGPVTFAVSGVSEASPDLAVVTGCAHDHEIVVSAATGAPVAGVGGRAGDESITSAMELTVDGWKLADQAVVMAPCGS
jgi:hypothetical protein